MGAVPAKVVELRRRLDREFPDAQPIRYATKGGVATGLAALDAALPAGGFPRGRVTLWLPGCGTTAVLRSTCGVVTAMGERAAWVDGTGGVAGVSWEAEALLFRPGSEQAALCVEELLRSGGFALVILTSGGAGLGDGEGVRLGHAAREGGSAFVVVAGGAPVSHLRVRSSYDVSESRWKRGPFGEPAVLEEVAVRARLESMGLDRRVRFRIPVEHHDVRLSLEPRLVDRRGVRR